MRKAIYAAIDAERKRQDDKWGGPSHDDEHLPREWRAFREKFESVMRRAELVKIAALAVAQIEAIDRELAEGRAG